MGIDKMKAFVTGVGGQLGHDIVIELAKRGYEAIGSDIASTYSGIKDGSAAETAPYYSLDITDAVKVQQVVAEVQPDVVFHCAAWTAVDLAEDEDKQAKVRAINVGGTQNIADACKTIGAKMIYLSTDYVFDGQGTEPWQADCKDYKPLNVYGQTKLDGEFAVANTIDKYFIVRIAWVFGKNGNNFIKTMLNIGKKFDTLRVVNDQIGTPTYTVDLARLLVDMAETEKYGYYHATNEGGYISWYDFACEIFKEAGYTTVKCDMARYLENLPAKQLIKDYMYSICDKSVLTVSLDGKQKDKKEFIYQKNKEFLFKINLLTKHPLFKYLHQKKDIVLKFVN